MDEKKAGSKRRLMSNQSSPAPKPGFTRRRMNPIDKFASSMSNFKDHGMQIENLHPNIQPKRLNHKCTTRSKFPVSHSAKNTSLSGQEQRRNISSPLSTPSSRRLATVNLEDVPSIRTNSQRQERPSLFQLPASSILPRVNQPVQNDITKEKSFGSSNHASTNQKRSAKSNASDCSGSKNLLASFNAAAESDDTSKTGNLNE